MKKILISILTVLGIGLSFCSAQSCTSNINACSINGTICDNGCNSSRNVFSIHFDIPGQYSINGFTYYNQYSTTFSGLPLYVCPITSFSDYYWSDYVQSNCSTVSYTVQQVSTNNYFVSLTTPYIIDSSTASYLTFVFLGDNWNCPQVNIIYGDDWGFESINIPFDTNISYKGSSSYGPYLQPVNVCYSMGSNPKFKVNYGNTSYEYELEDNLFIHLKSPIIQSGNTFTYVGSTGINLYFNNTSQFYSKPELYLNTPSRFFTNIFNPVCM